MWLESSIVHTFLTIFEADAAMAVGAAASITINFPPAAWLPGRRPHPSFVT